MAREDWSVVTVTADNADTIQAELAAIYDSGEPTIACPVTEGTPDRTDFDHFIENHALDLQACYENGVLRAVYLMAGNQVRAGWGYADKRTLVDTGLDALLPFFGGTLVIDPNIKGWVTREWLDNYSLNVGPFDMTRTDHPRGKQRNQTMGPITDWDDHQWVLQIWEDAGEPGGFGWYFDVRE